MKKDFWRFYVDIGGTFTDCLAVSPEGAYHQKKVLSSDDSVLLCLRSFLGLNSDEPFPFLQLTLATTIATNTLLEKKGSKVLFICQKGFKDMLSIGTQQRSDLFSLKISMPFSLHAAVLEIPDRITPDNRVLVSADDSAVFLALQNYYQQGYRECAICLLHNHLYSQQEQRILALAKQVGFTYISCGHEMLPELGYLKRSVNTVLDAYLSPTLKQKIHHLSTHLSLDKKNFFMMSSNGGLVSPTSLKGAQSLLSGPVAGALATSALSTQYKVNLLGFDMGGTSTDICVAVKGQVKKSYSFFLHDYLVHGSSLNVESIAAGGGSICRLQRTEFKVGPDASGSHPGPLCYAKKDSDGVPLATELCVTDVNLILGRILPTEFPLNLHLKPVINKLKYMQRELKQLGETLSIEEIAESFFDMVIIMMAKGVEKHVFSLGYKAKDFVLNCYGGAAGQHACALAKRLGIKELLFHPWAGLLSTLGLCVAKKMWEQSFPVNRLLLSEQSLSQLNHQISQRLHLGKKALKMENETNLRCVVVLDLCFKGTEYCLNISGETVDDYKQKFLEAYQAQFGYVHKADIEIRQCRVELFPNESECPTLNLSTRSKTLPKAEQYSMLILQGKQQRVPVYRREQLPFLTEMQGPLMVLDAYFTLVVEPEFVLVLFEDGCLYLKQTVCSQQKKSSSLAVSSSLLQKQFQGISEQMGCVLQRSAMSLNIRERLDFSCALFTSTGQLIANAHHIPVHLGAMSTTVRSLLKNVSVFKTGDVYVSNNPYKGGSHLPDVTCISPVFFEEKLLFFVATRAHHEDIGGITPGSMPALSRHLLEEGVLIDDVRLVSAGCFDEALFDRLFKQGQYPSRKPKHNKADLQAQIAANYYAVQALRDLVSVEGSDYLYRNIHYCFDLSAQYCKESLIPFFNHPRSFSDTLDDGAVIKVSLYEKDALFYFDFSASSMQQSSNLNVPPAIVEAVVVYTLRTLIDKDIPLNDGLLRYVRILLAPQSILNPGSGAAVAAGNVETSQRLADVLFAALGLAAASQGTMNNVSFGNDIFGYYETIAGGTGAGPGFSGASGVHSHMTNTRITDPEVLESSFPVRLHSFSYRSQSGGLGQWKGGDGLYREYEFLAPLKVSLLTQRRVNAPFGLADGEAGQKGQNVRLFFKDGAWQHRILANNVAYQASRGERLAILTPGGGGWGPYDR
ncbi:MAG: hydantoinase B/oxoprolinase family protein [bacterium]